MKQGIFSPDALIFDVDGVLLDVQNSFPEVIRLSILEGWEKCCGGAVDAEGYSVAHARILKRHGAFNDDYDIAWFLLSMAASTGETLLSRAFPSPRHLALEIETLDGNLMSWAAARYGNAVNNSEVRKICRRLYMAKLHKLEKPMLRCHWKELPLPAAIYTGRNGEEWALAKQTLGWEDFPESLVVNSDSGLIKPSPGGLSLLCERLGSSNPVFFGDTGSDIKASQAFGKGYFVAVGDLLPEAEYSYETPEEALKALLNFKFGGNAG